MLDFGEGFGECADGPGGGGHREELVMAIGEAGLEIRWADRGGSIDAALDMPGAVGGLVVEKPFDSALEIAVVALPGFGATEGIERFGRRVSVGDFGNGHLGPGAVGVLEAGEVSGGGLDVRFGR